MKILCRIPTIIVLLITLSGAAYAGELYTPPINSSSGAMECSIVNVSESDKTVTIQIFQGNWDDQYLFEETEDLTIIPGGAYKLSSGYCSDGTCTLYCKFIVEGRKRNFRASGCVRYGSYPDYYVGCVSAE
jgi:hypothetical protein